MPLKFKKFAFIRFIALNKSKFVFFLLLIGFQSATYLLIQSGLNLSNLFGVKCVSTDAPFRSLNELSSSANDRSKSASKRSLAVFALFAHYLRGKDNFKKINSYLPNEYFWLDDSDISERQLLAGNIGVVWPNYTSMFTIQLLSKKGGSGWSIYLFFEGDVDVPEVVAFFKQPNSMKGDSVKLHSFVLCYPPLVEDERIKSEVYSRWFVKILPSN